MKYLSWVPNICEPAIPVLDSDPKEQKTGIQASTCTFHNSISHNRQKVETAQISMNGWMYEQNVHIHTANIPQP